MGGRSEGGVELPTAQRLDPAKPFTSVPGAVARPRVHFGDETSSLITADAAGVGPLESERDAPAWLGERVRIHQADKLTNPSFS